MRAWGGAKVPGVLLGAMLLFSSFQTGLDSFFQKEPLSQSTNDNVPHDDEIKQAFAQSPPTPDGIQKIKNYVIYGLNSVR